DPQAAPRPLFSRAGHKNGAIRQDRAGIPQFGGVFTEVMEETEAADTLTNLDQGTAVSGVPEPSPTG
ncbi:hypothetical protein ACWF94_36990, partial [Streptomyces sp. NPDC055078]